MDTAPRTKRHDLYFLEVYHAGTGGQLGQLVDISHDGIRILSDAPFELGRTFPLRILVPQSGKPDFRLEFDAETRWTRPEPNASTHLSGLHIPSLSSAQRAMIDHLVHDFGYVRMTEAPVAVRKQAVGGAPRHPLSRFLQALIPGKR